MENINSELVAAAKALWAETIREGRDDHRQLFIENEWGWAFEKHPDYCGHTVAVAARRAGVNRDVCYYLMPSTSRLAGKVASTRHVEPLQPVEPVDLQAGDIITVNPTRRKPWGTHVVLALDAPDGRGYYPTIEGNAYGKLGDGSNGRGVVKKYRTLTKTARVYRVKEGQWASK